MKKFYRKMERKANGKIREISAERIIQIPLPILEVAATAYGEVERISGEIGLMIVQAFMKEEAERIAGRRGAHDPERDAWLWGAQNGYVYFAGKKVGTRRQRVRGKNGREIELESYKAFQNPDRMREAVARRMMVNVSTRNYHKAVEDFVEGCGIEKSSVSRHFVAATAGQLREFLERDLSGMALCAIFVDGIDFSGHLMVVSLGLDIEGRKHVLGLREGATENATVCGALLEDMLRRGLDAEGKYLFVLDGSKALRKAVMRFFGKEATVQRCQQHKRENVRGYLAPEHQEAVDARIRKALNENDYQKALKSLHTTAAYLDRINPSAAASLREAIDEMLTVHKLGVPPLLRKTLCTTNPIESCFSITRHITGRVKRWREGDMVQRWAVAALLEAEKKFRRVKGYKDIPVLLKSLNEKSVDSKEVAA